MVFSDGILITGLGFVVVEAIFILIVNTMRGFWELVNLTHILSAILWCIYITFVIYASRNSNLSDEHCDMVWKITSSLYIVLNMAVYSFYYARSKVWRIIN